MRQSLGLVDELLRVEGRELDMACRQVAPVAAVQRKIGCQSALNPERLLELVSREVELVKKRVDLGHLLMR